MKSKFMDYVWLPFRVMYKFYYLIVFSVLMLISFPLYYFLLKKSTRFKIAFRIMRIHAYLLVFFAGVKLKVLGKENIPLTGAFVICPNHTSFLDTFCLYHLIKRYFVFVGKREIEKWPLFHIFYTSGMNILVDRSSTSGSFKALRRMSLEIDNGNPIMIFPEGTRPLNPPNLGPFKQGAFSLAIQKQIPILPISFVSNWKRLGIGGFFSGKAGPGLSEVVIHPPIVTKGLAKNDLNQLQEKVRAIIDQPLSTKYNSHKKVQITYGHFPDLSQ